MLAGCRRSRSAVTGHSGESGDLFLVLMGWSFVTAVSYFLQRVFQPTISVTLFGGGMAHSLARSLRTARLVRRLTVVWLVGAATVLMTGMAEAWPFPVMIGLLLAHAPVYLLMSYSVFVVENASAKGLRTSAASGAMGTVAVAIAGAVLIPRFGAAGAVCALAAMELTVSTLVWLRLRPGRTGNGE